MPRTTWLVHTLLLIFFFVSGICGLVYEVVWSRMLTLVMGNTVFATSTVLAAFMGGLALGSFVVGRIVDRYGRPLIFYGSIECILGLYCLSLPLLLEWMVPFYQVLYRAFSASPFILTFFQLFYSGLLILIPSALMGGTLPVLGKYFVTREDEVGSTAGRLYSINTIGAVVGAISAGFILVPHFGVQASLYGAALVNIGIGGLTFTLSVKFHEGNAPQATSRFLLRSGDKNTWEARLILIAFAVSGVSALIYEVAWTRSLSLLLGPSVHAFSMMLGAFISGLALGSLIASRFVDRGVKLLPFFAMMQWGAAFATLAIVPFINYFPGWIREQLRSSTGSFSEVQIINVTVIIAVLLIPATFLGALFPIAVKLYSRSIAVFGKRLGTLYAGNTVGAVLGSISAGFILIPLVGLQNTIYTAVMLNGAVGAVVMFYSGIERKTVRVGAVFAPVCVLLIFLLALPSWYRMDLLSGPYKYFYMDEAAAQNDFSQAQFLYYQEGVTGTVAVKQKEDRRLLSISGKIDAGSGLADMVTQVLVGQIPLLLAPDPEKVLIIGLASGVTAGSVAQHPVKNIDTVEISHEVKEAAAFFSEVNHNVLKDERLNLILQDGRNHLLLTDQTYDVIISEPSNPWMAGIGNLYTREFFELSKRRLDEDGLMIQWVEAYHMPNHLVKSIIQTFSTVYPHVSLWVTDTEDPGDIFLIGSEKPLSIDVELLKKRTADPEIRRELLRYGAHQWWQILQRAMAGGVILREAVHDAPLHTDDLPFLEYELPKSLHQNTLFTNALWIDELIQSGSQGFLANQSVILSERDRTVLKSAQSVVAAQFSIMRAQWKNLRASLR